MTNQIQSLFYWMVRLIRVIAVVTLAFSIPIYSQQTIPPLTRSRLTTLSTAPETRDVPQKFIKDIVEKLKIGFLPTREEREKLRADKVPESIIDVLTEYTALYLRVCEFECQNCKAENGKVLARQVRDAIAASRGSNNAFTPFFEGGIDPQLCSVEGLNNNDTNHVLVLVTGTIVRNRQKYQIEVKLSYLNFAEIGGKFINRKSWEVKVNESTQEVNRQIAEWVIDSLKRSM